MGKLTYTQDIAPATPLKPADNVKLFQPLTIRGVTFRNRIGVSPMCMYSSEDGHLNDFHLVHLGTFALKGAGFICIEATAVEPEGRISPTDSGLWKDSQIEPIRRISNFIHEQGSLIGIQIGHAGRKASTLPLWKAPGLATSEEGGWSDNVWAPSDVAFDDAHAKPHALSVEDIHRITASFAATAKRADAAGIDVLELHGAHGYLTHEFLSGNSNKRTDKYGGSFENRIRFLLETVAAVRAVWPEQKPLFVRISATDYAAADSSPFARDPNGWDIEQSVELAKRLYAAGVDLVDVSSGGNVSLPASKYPIGPGYQVPFSEKIKKETGGLTSTVGIITDPKQAEEILVKGQADIVLLAREFLRDSGWALRAAKELGVDVKWANQFERGKRA
ncbi:NADH:flavin oxidoreductase/NADH oxidase [Jimgerdemannia flammicorona]|uniref:NADH:flavin oxidoreductase/NADH oxidase n=1 Tax=Jimgerdemannia flammicorona TaxID=994334 RepID=A0A433PFE5_9FUNG|nr:NADH:flavin oxidoreductase/NADH oxidase [Jimgerdemannia flammicorona]